MSSFANSWDLILPVKPIVRAKTRLLPDNPDLRRRLAIAFALDVAGAAARSGRVGRLCVVGTSLPLPRLPGIEVRQVTEPVSTPPESVDSDDDPTLNTAMVAGVRELRGSAVRPIVTLVADLPSLRASDLASVLDHFRHTAATASPASHGIVTDATGRGTTALLCGSRAEPRPRFGRDSAERHLQHGATDLSGVAGAGLRLDVDDAVQLRLALQLGVGPATARALASR